jgi:hypothetical protein
VIPIINLKTFYNGKAGFCVFLHRPVRQSFRLRISGIKEVILRTPGRDTKDKIKMIPPMKSSVIVIWNSVAAAPVLNTCGRFVSPCSNWEVLVLQANSKGKSIRFDTVNRICEVLSCQPGEILEYVTDKEYQALLVVIRYP